MLDDKQRGVLQGMMSAVAIIVAAYAAVLLLQPPALLPLGPFPETLSRALAWSLLPVTCLAVCIGALARHRFFTPADIDGGGLAQGTEAARILQSLLQNTLEQAVLAVATYTIWAAVMPITWQGAVPVAAILFTLGRVLFWRGSARGAPARAFGFALTFHSSTLLLPLIALHLLLG
jgi:hypothetical protein